MLKLKPWLFFIFIVLTTIHFNALSYGSENLTGEKGLFRLLSAEQPTAGDYHFLTSLEYFRENNLLKDSGESTIERTRATMAFGYAFQNFFMMNLHSGFHFALREPQSASTSSGSEAINLVRTGLSATGFLDLSPYIHLSPKKLLSALSIWVDMSKISRFIKGPNIVPRLIFTSDFSESPQLPFRLHANFGFHPANGNRYYSESDAVRDFDRLATETLNSWAFSSSSGVDFPFRYINPSIEFHLLKVSNSSLSSTPKWLTVGIKGRPFPQRNIEIFGATDIGLSSFSATSIGTKPEHSATPLWNLILGFAISRFGQREGQVSINESDLQDLKERASNAEGTLQKIKTDLEYNIVQGRAFDAATKEPLGDIEITFPESADIKSFKSDSSGHFLRYFKSLSAARMVFSKEGYEPSSKFLTLKPGEKISVDIELKRELPGQDLSEFIATLFNQSGEPLAATVKLTKKSGDSVVSGQSDLNGQLYMKIPVGDYTLTIQAEGFNEMTEALSFQKGRAILRSYTLTRKSKQ